MPKKPANLKPEQKIVLAADHAGFNLKEHLKHFLNRHGWKILDLGTDSSGQSCDYPLIAFKAAKKVAAGEFPFALLVCGSGVGMAIAANKLAGIRAVACQDSICTKFARSHNNANILCLGERLTTPLVAEEILNSFLNTPFLGDRHQRRIQQILDFENAKKEGN